MSYRLLGLTRIIQPIIKSNQIGNIALLYTHNKIGTREYVGYGLNGSPTYFDRVGFPFPAIRFREETAQIKCLQEKEKSDWNELTIDDKKTLYRHSFCQTYAEMLAPTGYWKMSIGITLIIISAAIILNYITNIIIYPVIPFTFSEKCQKAQLKRILALEVNPVSGISSKWDYKNQKWK